MVAKEGLPKAKAAQLYEVRSLWLLCGATALSEGGGCGGENTRLSISCRAPQKLSTVSKETQETLHKFAAGRAQKLGNIRAT